MYKIQSGLDVKEAFTIRQALYLAGTMAKPVFITLSCGTVLEYTGDDLLSKQPATMSAAKPNEGAAIFSFFFEGVERGWIDLSHAPNIRAIYDTIKERQR